MSLWSSLMRFFRGHTDVPSVDPVPEKPAEDPAMNSDLRQAMAVHDASVRLVKRSAQKGRPKVEATQALLTGLLERLTAEREENDETHH